MQPYFVPYLGYFQLMCAADKFLIYDQIQFTKKGWINRNRISNNGQPDYITLSLKKDSDYLNISQRCLSDNWVDDKQKLLNRFHAAYRGAQQFEEVHELFVRILSYPSKNLHDFLVNSIVEVKEFLSLPCELVNGPEQDDTSLRSVDRILNLCEVYGADEYLNPIGGLDLYKGEDFKRSGVKLAFLKMNDIQYQQSQPNFLPSLSVLDVLMFNDRTIVRDWVLLEYSILPPSH